MLQTNMTHSGNWQLDESAGEGRWAIGACLALLLIAGIFFHFNTAQGIGIFTDSTRYMGISARSYDAPVYHWLLMFGRNMGFQFTTTATIVAVATLIANVTLIFALIARATRNWLAPALGTALITLSPQFVTLHASAMSEPPFLTFLLLTIWFALDYFETDSRRALMLSSILLGFATLTRFAAPPLGAAIACVILASPNRDLRQRLRDVGLLACLGGAIFFIWVGYSQLTMGRSIGRDLWFYGNMGSNEWLASLRAMAAWILPDVVPLMVRVPLLVLFLGSGFRYVHTSLELLSIPNRASTKEPAVVLPIILGFFFAFYMGFMLLSVSIEANLTLTGRYAFPAYVAVAMLLTLQINNFKMANPDRKMAFKALIGITILVCSLHGGRSTARTVDVYREGYGYQHQSWRASSTLEIVRRLPAEARIFTNGPDVIAYRTGRSAEFVPQEYSLRTNLPEPGRPFNRQMADLRAIAGKEETYIVFFDKIDWRHYLVSEEKIARELGLRPVVKLDDGRIYRIIGSHIEQVFLATGPDK